MGYRALFLKLYLEKSLLDPQFNYFLDECKKVYPEYIQMINELANNHNLLSEEQLSRKLFGLLKTLASDINNSVYSLETPILKIKNASIVNY